MDETIPESTSVSKCRSSSPQGCSPDARWGGLPQKVRKDGIGFENEMLALLFAREILERCANEKEALLWTAIFGPKGQDKCDG